MKKIMKRSLALILAVMLCLSAMPFSAFAADTQPDVSTSSEVEAVMEPDEPDLIASPEPDDNSSPRGSPEEQEEMPAATGTEVIDETSTEQEEDELIPGTQFDVEQVWSVASEMQISLFANFGTSGTLYVGDYCFPGGVGTPPTLGERIGPMPIETMRYGSNNVAAFCIEHAKESGDGMGYTWMDLSTNNQETLGTILALGFQWNSPTVWAVPSDNSDQWVVTQVLIWETIAGNAFVQGNGLIEIKPGVDDDMQMISTHAHNPTKFMQYYRDLKQKLSDYLKVPSFANKDASKAETITLRWDGSKYSATVTDNNGVLKNYPFDNAIPGVKAVSNGNTLTLSTTEPILNPKTSSEIRSQSGAAGGKGAVAVWRTEDRSFQDFATYNADGGDPVRCFIKVKTDAVGNAGLKKTSEDGKVSGIQFQITGSDGSSKTVTTDANGNIDMEGMPIYAADGSKITYTATELNVPNRYVKPQDQTFQLTEGQTASIHFENKLKRWRVTVTKADTKTGSTAQGNGSLKGATFGVYQGSTLVKEYTVGDDLTFTTDYYPFGEDWTLKEISAGEGYKVSTVVTDLCEIPAGSNEEFNDNTVTVVNEIKRGGVSVQKRDSKTGTTPQGDANFAGIVFEIINDSQNSVEVDGKVVAPGKVAKEITTNAQGFATTGPNSLPYGDYIIREKSTNTSMLKTFTDEIKVTVSDEGKEYPFFADNEVVRGGLAVQKRDSQTGEVPQGNADFSGIVFEIVNSSANAVVVDGKTYAPGNVVATLTTNEKGYASTADDALPYGKYTIREKSTNKSMLLTFKQQTVTVAADKKVYSVYADNDVVRGGLSVQKHDSQTGATPQGDANFAGIVFEIINNSKNPVMVGGTSYAPGKVVKEITTNAQGFATTGPNDLPYGDYLVREKSTNKSMLKTFTKDIEVTVSEHSKVYPFTAENDVVRCGIEIDKHDSQTGATPQGNADFAGIVFEIVNVSTNPVVVEGKTIAPNEVAMTLTTDENGHAETADDALPYGRYTVREKSTNKSMLLTWPQELVTGTENKKMYAVTAVDDVVRGGLSVEKRDTITGSTPQGDADFEGIVFEILNNSRNPVIVNDKSIAPGEVALTLTTDAEGKCSTANDALPYGEYILHEASTNKSMLNTAEDQIVIIDEHLHVYPFYMDNEVVRGGVLIEKRDLESLLLTPLGGASLDGTLFEITNKSKHAVYVNGALYEPDEVCLTIEVKDGVAQSGDHALPYGTYTLAESKPGKGYLWTDKKVRDFTVRADGEVTEYREGEAAYNQVIRGDLKFVKVGEKNMHRFANVAFKLTSQTTGESHILVTDENGEVRTETQWNAHSLNTNGNDEKLEIEWDDLTGSWYGLTTEGWIVETQNGLCALPFDQYTLEELRCKGNEGYELVTVPNITISRNNTVIELGTIDDHEDNGPKIGTTATVNGEKIAEPGSEITLVDVVAYSNLEVGKTYKLSGILMDKETGKPLEVDGQQVTAEKEFTPEKSSGTEEMTFTFNASALAGKAVVVFEDLYEGNKKVTSHADIEDEGQTVTFTEVKIGTTATVDGEHTAEPVGEITLVDTVAYSGLVVGKEYTVKGVLMDKATGEPLLVDGQEITAEATFIASQSEGSIDIPFTFDGSALSGKTVVAFETLYHEGLEVAVHADIEDEDQTVTFSDKPEVKTTATADGEKTAEPVGEITIVDVVSYTGLTPGKTYTLKGILMDKDTNQPLLVGDEEVTAEKEFTPETASGTEEITFTFDASALAGKAVVVFEHLYNEDVEVAAHADITDEGQTVTFEEPEKPEIKTKAAVDGANTFKPLGEITVVDTVSYSNLAPGKTYTVKGVLMDKATGEALLVNGQEITAEVEFTPVDANGTVEIAFTFDATGVTAKSIVVFEGLYDGEIEVAVHADINDEDQTVILEEPDKPEIKTTATVNGKKTAEPAVEITLVDTVSYKGLVPGKTYVMKGVLMDKGSGEKLLIADKQITAEQEFTPDKPEDTVEVMFTFNAAGLGGKSVVVFETLYQEDVQIATHADIEDEGQTVEFDGPEIKTKATVDGEKEVDPLDEITLIDTVTYKNLRPGKIYVVKGVLMDKGTGEKLLVDGKEITAETTFTPDKPNGTVDIPFTFRASALAGKTVVVFESLYHEGIEVAVHADIEDDDQTIIIHRKGGLLIRKTSEDDFVEGISFIVAGEGYEETFTTDKQGEIYIQDLVPGEYTITEVDNDITARYIIEAGKTVTVTSGDDVAEVEFHNKLKRGSVYVVKTAEGAPDANLSGAEFFVYTDVDGNGQFDKETDTLFGKLEYTEDRYSLSDLPVGGYFIHEGKAPEGYTADDGYYHFTLAENGEQVEVTNTADKDAGFVNKKQTGSLRIVKVEKGTDKPLAGATFCVKDENGQVVAEGKTDKNGEIIFDNLPFGTYTYQEVYAPDGYKLDDTEHKFEIGAENLEVEVTAENEKIPNTPTTSVPKTGDSRPNPWLIGGIGLAMLALAGCLLRYLFKRRRA